ncbi:hypothetical protein pah_c029o067 [Parachlamydia acanthamoebae str. Hall's coccus]|nr:hypothetical protein pah_c029o067 [Parachlamydia acanthamoebae str. Hall's coccus]
MMKKNYLGFLIAFFCLTSNFAYAASPRDIRLATNTGGSSIAYWTTSSTNDIIQAAVLPAGGSWSTPVDFAVTGLDFQDPRVAINSSGNAVMVWYTFDSGLKKLYASAYDATLATWSTPTQISTNSETILDDFYVKLSDTDTAVIVWNSFWITTGLVTAEALVNTLGTWTGTATISN